VSESLNERSRPGEKAASSKTSSADITKSSVSHRRYWAQQFLDKGKGWPVYGSPEWCALQVDDPRRVAACVAAAEIYTRDFYDNLEERLREEIEQARVAYKKTDDEEYVRAYREHRATWSKKSSRVVVPFAERRRRQLKDAKPRPGDFPGLNGGGIA